MPDSGDEGRKGGGGGGGVGAGGGRNAQMAVSKETYYRGKRDLLQMAVSADQRALVLEWEAQKRLSAAPFGANDDW